MTDEATLEDLDRARTAGTPVIDVRESDEYAEGHVPGARLLPLGLVPVLVHELPRDSVVHVVCGSGARSAQAVEVMRREGVDARSVAGGTQAWIRSGRPVETGAPRP